MISTMFVGNLPAETIELIPEKVVPAVSDVADFQTPDRVHLSGWVGQRIEANEANRLVKLDPARLLEGYRKRPGRQAWDGEHVGKWLHAATLAWANTGDAALRKKLDYVASELCKCQLGDGYLGTYVDKDRWTEWDVWAHKYNLIGLITYMRYTGNVAPLQTCRRMADLLCNTFGDEPGKRDIIKAGYHVGLAPTSVLEPMVLLYRFTGEPRYLGFCTYILRAWEQPNGPKVLSTLLRDRQVNKVGNGKAYEMLSCLNGALEYYRTVGDPKILEACLNAWQDIVTKRLYITGTASYGELFHDDYDLPNIDNVGETCVTVTWLQFNVQLLRLTGEARFAEQLERVVLNQLFGAQQCDGSAWGYYVQMEGRKPYSSTLDGHCCLSSGPRGVALIPGFVAMTDAKGVAINLYDAGSARLNLRDGSGLTLTTDTHYPADGNIKIMVRPAVEKTFVVRLRIPAWCRNPKLTLNGRNCSAEKGADGYVAINRRWKQGDQIELRLQLEPRVIIGDHRNTGKIALMYGPLVLAADAALIPPPSPNEPRLPVSSVATAGEDLGTLQIRPEPAPPGFDTWPGAQIFRMAAVARRTIGSCKRGTPIQAGLVPFADAGTAGSDYKVWLPLARTMSPDNLLEGGTENRSRRGNLDGSIIDADPKSVVVTFDGKIATQDWFSVTLENPAVIRRVVFIHGRTFHDGGWFDTTTGKPAVQIKASKEAQWEAVGLLKNYPATTATTAGQLTEGERFDCELSAPIQAWAVRVIGKPACGDSPGQAFSSCAELQAFEH